MAILRKEVNYKFSYCTSYKQRPVEESPLRRWIKENENEGDPKKIVYTAVAGFRLLLLFWSAVYSKRSLISFKWLKSASPSWNINQKPSEMCREASWPIFLRKWKVAETKTAAFNCRQTLRHLSLSEIKGGSTPLQITPLALKKRK